MDWDGLRREIELVLELYEIVVVGVDEQCSDVCRVKKVFKISLDKLLGGRDDIGRENTS